MKIAREKYKTLGGWALVILGLFLSYLMARKIYDYFDTGEIILSYRKGADFVTNKGVQFSGNEALVMSIAILVLSISILVYGVREIRNANKSDKGV